MERIPEEVLDAVRRATDVAELIGRATPLRKSGRSWKGRCPFHQEKTPSFHVWPESGIWKCFGCGVGGNAFTFLMQREGLRFHEAVAQLAREAGIALPRDDDPEAARRAARTERLREVTEWACRHFQAMLRAPEGAPARDYFKRRGITGATARDFRLGWAPPGWDRMIVAARDAGIPFEDLLEAGMVVARDPGPGGYDRFRERVVFPIADAQGRVIAFGARTLGSDEPKYINSPETPLYTKGRHLYAFHLARGEMLRSGEGAVMEGYTDVILAHQAGYKVAVAGLGTALTPDQARKLAQYAKKLWLVYDGDAAGMRAAERAIPAFLPEPIETRVCVLPGEKDPADVFVEAGGAEAFRASLAGSREAFDHLLAARAAAHEMATVPGRSAAVDDCLSALVGVEDELRRALYLKRLADEYGVPEDVATRRLQELRLRARPHDDAPHRGPPRRAGGSPAGPHAAPQPASPAGPPAGPGGADHESFAADLPVEDAPPPGAFDEPHGPDAGTAPASAAAPPPVPAGPPPPVERLLVEALLGAPRLLDEAPPGVLESVSHPVCRRLLALLLEARDAAAGTAAPTSPGPAAARPVDVDRLLGTLAEPEAAALGAELRASGRAKPGLEEQGRDCLKRLEHMREDRRLREGLRDTDSEAEETELLRSLQELHRRRARK